LGRLIDHPFFYISLYIPGLALGKGLCKLSFNFTKRRLRKNENMQLNRFPTPFLLLAIIALLAALWAGLMRLGWRLALARLDSISRTCTRSLDDLWLSGDSDHARTRSCVKTKIDRLDSVLAAFQSYAGLSQSPGAFRQRSLLGHLSDV